MKRLIFHFSLFLLLSFEMANAQPGKGVGVPRIMINPQGHTGKIYSLKYTPDGEKIISVSEDKSIRVWDVETGKQLKSFYCQVGDGPEGMLYASAVSPDGRLLAVGGYPVSGAESNYIVLIDLEKEEQLAMGLGHTNVINALDFSNDGQYLASGSDDGTVVLWKIEENSKLMRIGSVSLGSRVSSLSFAPNTMNLAVAFDQREVKLYNFAAAEVGRVGYPNTTLAKHKGRVKVVKHSPDGRYIASCDDNKTVILWSAQGEFINQIDHFDHEVNALTFSHDGKVLVTLNDVDGSGNSFSIPDCNRFTTFNGHNNTVMAVDFNPRSVEGNYQVASSGGGNNEIIIWNAINGRQLKTIKGRGNPVWSLKYTGESQLLISQNRPDDQTAEGLISFDLATFQIGRSDKKMQPSEAEAKLKGVYQKDLYQLQLPGGKTIVNIPAVDGRILVFETLPDGRIVVGSDFSLKIYNPGGYLQKELIGHTGSVRALAVSEDGKFIASGGEDQAINIWLADARGNVPSMWEVYEEEEYRQFFKAYGLDSVARVNHVEAWESAIEFLAGAREKVYRDFQKALTELGELIQPVATLFVADDTEWICYTPEGYFHCSSTGGQYFGWELNQGFHHLAEYYNAEQYFDILFRPDLLKEVLQTGKSAPEILREKGERVFDLTKLNRPSAGLFDQPLLASGQTRGIEQKKRAYQTENKRIKLAIDIYDGGGGVKEVNIYQNNKLILIDDEVKLVKEEKARREYEVDLLNGANDFKVVVLNYQNIESRPDHIVVEYVGELIATSDLYVFSVGINQYKNSVYNLNYAQPDALAFTQKIMQRSKRMFKNVHFHELYDERAVKENIVNTFYDIIANAKPQDVFVFYYAGHGSIDATDPNAEYYLVPHDVTKIYGDTQLLDEKGISATELKQLLGSVRSQKQLILLDACHSGGAVKTLLTRAAASEEKAIFQLARSTGVVLIAASGTQQFATEFEALGHGVFTYSLLEVLDGKGDAGSDQKITVNEVKAYMEDRVPELSLEHGGKAQYPTGFSNGQDFPISLIVE